MGLHNDVRDGFTLLFQIVVLCDSKQKRPYASLTGWDSVAGRTSSVGTASEGSHVSIPGITLSGVVTGLMLLGEA